MLTVGDKFREFDLTACAGGNPEEVLRVPDVLRTDELRPCDRAKGETTPGPVELLAGA
ncbi:hypothetical protein [Streptomyces dioscori]|uniref:hypothetical protein n=1 Tax=Streptomyces dioscori TaxID=2109333 RepID=UPI00131B3CB4